MTDKKASDTLDNKDNKKAIHYREIQYGFEWGCAKIVRLVSDDEKGWIALGIETPIYNDGLHVYVTKTGKVRVFDSRGEWKRPSKDTRNT